MTTRAIAMDATDERTERYRRAERAVWNHYGLEPTERLVTFEIARGSPADPGGRIREADRDRSWRPVACSRARPLVGELAGYRCILVDRPGCGLSSAVDWKKHDLRTVAPVLMGGVVDALGLERTDVIGHSIGGVWALRLAQDHASRVGKIGILGASPVLDEMPRPGFFRSWRRRSEPSSPAFRRIRTGRARCCARTGMARAWMPVASRTSSSTGTSRSSATPRRPNERAMIRDAVIRGGAWRPGVKFSPQSWPTSSSRSST